MRTLAINSDISSYNHQFCAISSGGSIANELASSGKKVTILNAQANIPSLPAISKLIHEIQLERPDILHCHGAEANFHGLVAGYYCAVPVLLAEEIGIPNHSRKARFVFRSVYKLANAVIAVSAPVKQALLEVGEVEEARCKVLLNPFQMLALRTPSQARASFHIGYVGRLEEVKNPIGLVRAISLLRDRDIPVRLTIVGDGTQRYLLEEEVTRLGLNECITFIGFSPRPFEVLNDISLYVLPSLSEGLSNSLVEAMSAGIPVLATAVGGTPDVINHGENGWLLAGPDCSTIAEGIEKCMFLKSEELEAVGRSGRQSVIERFSPKAFFEKCDAFYDSFFAKLTR